MKVKTAKTLFGVSFSLWTISVIVWIVAFITNNSPLLFGSLAIQWVFVGTNFLTSRFVKRAEWDDYNSKY